eukprot:TRINITY_DN3627_c0_g2_i1.p1 TRINITY_DN3627_c0_g2~~TRINITY_DN3627_c0_g2_i1.p1  ORF type:complete len:206 (+),score=8.18 TRINITY_DN3627_c0_g2_i1:183-800(+)
MTGIKLFKAFGLLNGQEYRSLNNHGVGLGLMISNNIVKCLGASGIVCESRFGEGSHFFFDLPKNADKTDTNDPKTIQDMSLIKVNIPHNVSNSHCSCRRILIVDDNDYNLMVLGRMVKKRNFEIIEAYDGEDAFKKLLSSFDQYPQCDHQNCRRVNLILSDLNMPGHDGFELIKSVRKLSSEHRNIPIILNSAFDNSEDLSLIHI